MEENKELETKQEELKYKIITLEDDVDDKNIKKLVEDILEEMNQAFENFKKWYEENKNSEKAQEMKEKFMNEMDRLAIKCAQMINDVKTNPQLQEKLATSKDTLVNLFNKASVEIRCGVNTILDNETVSKTIDSVSDKIVDMLHDEKVQNGIKATKKGILNVATNAYEGLKQVLKEKDEE